MTDRDPKWLLWFDRHPRVVPLLNLVSIICFAIVTVASIISILL